MRLDGSVAIVTGGASGIGKACCQRMVQEGARVAIFDVHAEAPAGSGGLVIRCDVSDSAQVRSAVDQVLAAFGAIHVLVNSAGIAVRKTVSELEEADWDRCVDVNLKGIYLISKYVLPHLTSGGSIIHIASAVGITGVRNRAVYTATKGAIVALTRNMALDYAERGIRVNCICPGFVQTPLLDGLLHDPEKARRLVAMHPLGRLGTAEDIANAALFLASREAAFITGHALVVDGGFSAGRHEDI
jgi:NAD(P)-dependent dehydrogenase (short-subunit alcohol dehydrogenase family)